MASTQEPIMGIYYGWVTGESGFKNQMDGNLMKIGTLMQIAVINRTLTAAPSTPANGDMYIPAAGATGVWSTAVGKIAIYRSSLAAWEFYTPKDGWMCVVVAETKLITYLSGAWTAGIAL